ncbi:MAG: hypothetical protein JXR76_01970 [Deltaproteobacteria bacterium]|nr:hypothetical protein [Deltaproteobacteria bacterium]
MKLVTSDKKSGAEQAPQSKEALVEQLADMLSELLPETDDFQEFKKNAALEIGPEGRCTQWSHGGFAGIVESNSRACDVCIGVSNST